MEGDTKVILSEDSKEPVIDLKIGDETCPCLIDTGTTYSILTNPTKEQELRVK